MRVMGIDFGERRVGIAISDPTGLIAASWGVLNRTSNAQVADRVATLTKELGVGVVVLGMPLDAQGGEGFQARRVRRFAALLEERLSVALTLWDERFTSVDAEALLRERGVRSGKRRQPIDAVAAAVLLQSYLDQRR